MNTIFSLTFSVFVLNIFLDHYLFTLFFGLFVMFCFVYIIIHSSLPIILNFWLEPLKRALSGAFFMRFNVCHHNVSQKLNVPEIEHFLSQGATRHPKHQGQDKIHCPSSQSFQTSYVNTKTTKDLKDYIQSCLP